MVQKYEIQLDSAVFVSPFFELHKIWQFQSVNQSFYTTDFDFERLQNLIPLSYVLYSDNDPYVPIEQSKLFAQKMHSSEIIIPGGKHLSLQNDNPHLKQFPLLLELCRSRFMYI